MYQLASALCGLLCLSLPLLAPAQTDSRLAQTKMPLAEVALVPLTPLDNEILLNAERAAREPGRAPHFAKNRAVDISPATHGSWALSEEGQQVWRLRIHSPNAKSLNLGFDVFRLPAGAQLLLYTPDQSTVMGPFTPADNEEHGELWTPVIPGDELVIELQLPPAARSDYALHLKSVNHDFLGFTETAALASGSCNLDVICGAADGFPLVDRYRDAIQSVGVYSAGGERFCTGFLVSNTRQDCTPFFITANHCGLGPTEAPSMVVYWNYFNSTCRPPLSSASGRDGDGLLSDFNTGAIHRASYNPSDLALVELDDPVSRTANAWFAGWDVRNLITTDTVFCVHHPDADEKRISFEFDGTSRSNEFGQASGTGNFLRVADWDIGTTEGGSSGSPLFNKQGRAIGKLTGGIAACGNDGYDVYGWLHLSWTGGGRNNSRLRNWLDPDNTGILAQDGYAQGSCSIEVYGEPVQQGVCAPDAAVFEITTDGGFVNTVNLSISGLAAGLQAVFTEANIAPGSSTNLQLSGTENVSSGTYTFTVIATDGTYTREVELSLSVDPGLADIPVLTFPVDASTLNTITPLLSWTELTEAFAYDLQLATDANFLRLILDVDTETNTYQSPPLSGGSTYYWRVRSRNTCGVSEWSTRSFTLASEVCGQISSRDVPVPINNGSPNTIESTLVVPVEGVLSSIRLRNLDITHSYVGDLSAQLRSPLGPTIQLFNRPRAGACFGSNMLVTLDDNATLSAQDLINTCNENPAVSGNFQPVDPFSVFVGNPASGEWTLAIRDSANGDGGALNEWTLEVCVDAGDLPDLTITPEATNFVSCLLDDLSLTLTLGPDFGDEPTVSVMGEGGSFDGFTSDFATDTRTLSLSWPDFTGNTAGNYPLTITVEGEGNSNTAMVNLNLLTAPEAAALQLPAQDGSVSNDNITFSWSSSGSLPVDTYTLELARDELFSDLVQTEETAQTSINLTVAAGLYYWRITARNECGQAISNFRRFEAITVGTYELGATQMSIFPNPSRERIQLELTESLGGELAVQLYTTSGQLLRQWQLPAQAGRQTLELRAIPAGVYWLRVRAGERQAIEKLVIY